MVKWIKRQSLQERSEVQIPDLPVALMVEGNYLSPNPVLRLTHWDLVCFYPSCNEL